MFTYAETCPRIIRHKYLNMLSLIYTEADICATASAPGGEGRNTERYGRCLRGYVHEGHRLVYEGHMYTKVTG